MLAAILHHLRGAVGPLRQVLREQTEENRRQADETHKHRDATAAVVVSAVREVGRAIVGELRRAGAGSSPPNAGINLLAGRAEREGDAR